MVIIHCRHGDHPLLSWWSSSVVMVIILCFHGDHPLSSWWSSIVVMMIILCCHGHHLLLSWWSSIVVMVITIVVMVITIVAIVIIYCCHGDNPPLLWASSQPSACTQAPIRCRAFKPAHKLLASLPIIDSFQALQSAFKLSNQLQALQSGFKLFWHIPRFPVRNQTFHSDFHSAFKVSRQVSSFRVCSNFPVTSSFPSIFNHFQSPLLLVYLLAES